MALFILDILLYKYTSPTDNYNHIFERLSLLLLLFVTNHICGYFAFLYIYIPLCVFPQTFVSSSSACYIIEIFEGILCLISLSVKFVGKQLVNSTLNYEAEWLNKRFTTTMYSVNYVENIKHTANEIISNILAVLFMAIILDIGVSKTIKRGILYVYTPLFLVFILYIPYWIHMFLNIEIVK